jgi:hypothetical protein
LQAHPLSHCPRTLRGMTEELFLYLLMAGLALIAISCVLWLATKLLGVMLPGEDAVDSDRKDP